MAVKLLISGESNSGKTTLIRGLEDSLTIYYDSKVFPFKQPHVPLQRFSSVQEIADTVREKVKAYKEVYGKVPKTIVFDAVSTIYEELQDACNKKYKGYAQYSALNGEVSELNRFLQEDILDHGCNVIIISHAVYDADTGKYGLVAVGQFAKRSAWLSVVDEAIFITVGVSGKRELHFRSTKYPARTLTESLPDSMDVTDFDMQKHLDMLADNAAGVNEFAL